MEMPMTLSVDNVVLSANVPLGATLREFLSVAGYPMVDEPICDGARLLSQDLELAHRLAGAILSTTVPAQMTVETPALVAGDLLVMAEH